MSSDDLKRLAFIRAYASTAVATGEGLYKKARGLVPGFAEPYLVQVEDIATATAAPIMARVQDKAADLLAFADAKVDGVYGTVSSALDYSRDLHAKNMASFASAKEAAYGFVEGYVDATKAFLDPQRYVDYAAGVGKAVVDTVAAYADPDKAVEFAASLYGKVASQTPVGKVIELADPLISAGTTQYTKAHDALVAQPLYKKLYDTAAALPALLADTTVYRKGYPLVAPVADPVVSNFAKSNVIKQIDEHLKPKTA